MRNKIKPLPQYYQWYQGLTFYFLENLEMYRLVWKIHTEALRFERRIIRILIIYYLERRPCILGPSGTYSAYFYLNRNHSNFCNSFCQTVVCLDWIFNGKENSFRILFVNNSSFFVEVYKKFIHSICLKSFLVHIILQTHV